MSLRALALMLIAVSLSYSVGSGEVKVTWPVEKVVSGSDVIDAGYIGPGQTLSVMVLTKVDTGGKYGLGGNWDYLAAEGLPAGWSSSVSAYGPELKVSIRAPADAPEGKYRLLLLVSDENDAEKIGDRVPFYIDVEVRHNLIDMSVSPEEQTVSVGSPARYTIRLFNPSTASDIFVVEGRGILGWNFKREVFIPPKSRITILYEFVNQEEEVIPASITAVSKSSNLIKASNNVTLTTRSNPYYDTKSVRNGLLLYPPAEFLLYSVLYFISSLM